MNSSSSPSTSSFLLTLVAVLLLGSFNLQAGEPLPSKGRLGWARLKEPSEHWNRHARGDPDLLRFIRQSTNLEIDPTWQFADVADLREMCKYPFLFSDGLEFVNSPKDLQNVGEYIRRGGFVMIDSCIAINRVADLFLAQELHSLSIAIPDYKLEPIPLDHDIYHCYFQMKVLPHTFFKNIYDETWARHGLYGVYLDNRLVGVISLSGIQCGWDRMCPDLGHNVECMKMLVNIYTYAITH